MCVSAGTEVATASASAAAAVVNCTEGPGSVLYSEIASTDPGHFSRCCCCCGHL